MRKRRPYVGAHDTCSAPNFAPARGEPDVESIGLLSSLLACMTPRLAAYMTEAQLAANCGVPRETLSCLTSEGLRRKARAATAGAIATALSVSLDVTHGREDTIVLPSMAVHTLECRKAATASWYEGVGHMPFAEEPERFNRELAALVVRATH